MPRRKVDPTKPNTPGTRLLLAIARHHALTALQATRAADYSVNSVKTVEGDLLRLKKHGYLRRQMATEKGIKDVFFLERKGKLFLDELGISYDERTHHRDPSGLHLSHRIAVNSVLIALEHSGYEILEMINEWQFSRIAIPVKLPDKTMVRYSPDAFIRIRVDGREYPIAIEVDRGAEHAKPWKRKVDEMVAFTNVDEGGDYPFRRLLGVDRLRFAIMATPGVIGAKAKEVRAENLHAWTHQRLIETGKAKWANLFFFRPLDPDLITGQEILFAPCWVKPGETEGRPLIGGRA